MKRPYAFEYATCGRCAGSGSYSYCSMYGSVCFGCGGRGIKLTKRGSAANAFFNALRSRKAADFKAGDLIFVDFSPVGFTGFAKVEKVEAKGERVTLTTSKGTYMDERPDALHIAGWPADEKAAMLNAALVYEAMLTKAGALPKKASAPTMV